jgi:uncharacterized protein
MTITKETIQRRLRTLEDMRKVRVLYAIESGSRAWGFASTNSDWDVRLIYVPTDVRWWLTVEPTRDVLENADLPDYLKAGDVDFAGWDLRKFFGLVSKSNPTAFEWLQSPLIYTEQWPFWHDVRMESEKFFSPKAALGHYVSMAKHNYREHLRDGKADTVKLKKYLYIARPLLCCHWVSQWGSPPPLPFMSVLGCAQTALPSQVVSDLIALVSRKQAGSELDEGPALPAVNAWFDSELVRFEELRQATPKREMPSLRVFDDLLALAFGL